MHSSEPQIREEILAHIEEVPPVAPVALRVMEMVDDLNTSAADLARVISRDQTLTAKVLRTCNSPYYGLATPVTSLSQGMVVLGLRTVRNLVLFHSLPVRSAAGTLGDLDRELWVHSVGCALGARFLSQECGGVDAELGFLSGLFHDIGRFLLNAARPTIYEALWHACGSRMPDCVTERRALSVDHMEIGGAALERWRMGTELVRAARLHHEPPAGLPRQVLVVRGAVELLRDPEDEEPVPGSALALLEIRGNRVAGVRDRLRASLEQETGMFLAAA